MVYDVNRGMWTREAVVCEVRPSGRSYWVTDSETGRKLLRSRRHLRRRKGSSKERETAQVAIKRTFTGKTTTRTEASTVTPPNPLEPTPRTVRFALGTKRS